MEAEFLDFKLAGCGGADRRQRLTATYGFSMVVAFYLLVRLEKRLTELTGAINQMCNCVERMEVTKR